MDGRRPGQPPYTFRLLPERFALRGRWVAYYDVVVGCIMGTVLVRSSWLNTADCQVLWITQIHCAFEIRGTRAINHISATPGPYNYHIRQHRANRPTSTRSTSGSSSIKGQIDDLISEINLRVRTPNERLYYDVTRRCPRTWPTT